MILDLAIDPGKHSAAISLWHREEGLLFHAAFIEVTATAACRPHEVGDALRLHLTAIADALAKRRHYFGVGRATIEMPKIYRTAHQKGDQRDIRDLTLVAGALAYVAAQWNFAIDLREPAEWKGDIPKDVTKRRVDSALFKEELDRIEWPRGSKKHNVYDALHIGLRMFTTRKA